jgi:hypothetical protein
MAELQGDNITNSAGSGGPTFPYGIAGNTGTPPADTVGSITRQTVPNGSPISLSNGVQVDIVSISLPAGTYSLNGAVNVLGSSGTTLFSLIGAIALTSATLPSKYGVDDGTGEVTTALTVGSFALNTNNETVWMSSTVTIASTTTFYLVGYALFSVSTLSASGSLVATRLY